MARLRRSRGASPPAGPVLTLRGWVAAGAGLASVGFGVSQHEPAFLQIGLFTWVLLAGAWVVARRNLAGVGVVREGPPAVFAGEVFPATVRVVRGARGGAGRNAELTDEFLGPLGEGVSVAGLGPGRTLERTVETRLRQRGINPTFRWSLRSTFPGGLWRTRRSGREAVAIKVFPRPIWPEQLRDPVALIHDAESGLVSAPHRAEGEYLGIRDFAAGDPLKLVHWRATARAQRLVVREFDQELPAGHALFFFSFATPGAPRLEDAFESALELLTGLLLGCREHHLPLTLCADFIAWRTLRLTGSSDASESLTLLAGARWSPASTLGPLAKRLAEVVEGSRVFIVSDTPLRHWQHLVPESTADVTCLSVAEMRRRRPLLDLPPRT